MGQEDKREQTEGEWDMNTDEKWGGGKEGAVLDPSIWLYPRIKSFPCCFHACILFQPLPFGLSLLCEAKVAGFSFLPYIFFLFGDSYFASFLVCTLIVFICTLCTHSGSPGTFWVPIWFSRHNWCLSGPTLQTGLSDHQVQPVPFWFSLYF